MPQSAGRPEQPLDMTAGPLPRLAGELRRLRGSRTYRELKQQTHLSVGTLQAATKGERLPSWRVVKAFAEACGADTAALRSVRELWRVACAAEGRQAPDDPPEVPPVPEPGSMTSAAQFIAMMKQLRAWAGNPSYAELNRRAPGHNLLPPATLSDVLHKMRLPRLDFVLAFVRACDLDDEQAAAWEQAWAVLRERELSPAGGPPADLPAGTEGWQDRCPYPGLAAFDEDGADFFYGRDQMTAQLVDRLDGILIGTSMLAVVGPSPALLLNRRGGRLSARGAHDVLLAIAAEARLDPGFSGQVLRHTFGTQLVRGGYDLVLVAELMGHARTETTRGYSLPTAADAQAAINSLPADR
jgi:Phage integrase family/Helix-turn-helix domain